MNKKKFTKMVLNKNIKIFIIYVTFFDFNLIYPARKT